VSAVIQSEVATELGASLPLLAAADASRVLAWHDGRAIRADEFLAHVRHVAALLPSASTTINLCEDRYAFLVAFCAAICRGQTNLLPPSRAPQSIADIIAAHPESYMLIDGEADPAWPHSLRVPALPPEMRAAPFDIPQVRAGQVVVIGYTSGSTGVPKANPKTWSEFHAGTRLNVERLRAGLDPAHTASVVATVPPQHMYGMELSVLLPLLGDFAVHSGKPLFPADVAAALSEVPAPRLLVTTPVHLRALLREDLELPPLTAIVSATAPLSVELAQQAESRLRTHTIELFGSTETCVIAHRRTASQESWLLYPGVNLTPQPDGTLVSAPYLRVAVVLQDIVELLPESRFRLCGRNSDLLEIAGKRASLGDLTRRLLALPGVLDAVIFQLDPCAQSGISRLAALVVAPEREERALIEELRGAMDPVFLPRPLIKLDRLPRNEAGKLPRSALLAALRA
jgi:acyl-coenzyme A synthetase/AMP-(fatty) acid ligase